ncbi:outer membrane beta-barrel protein [Flavobacterium algicola]|uniref:outer membrane beta-barrel protein n=1 Tax=Flavobacterium algicola TaxID=556529 RepID=UPI001EFDFDE2|nr:outer membrane beta-barrel protein [Flavobacterium algicola]MCG9791600.1 outer membrane beta-barrel protein [Flavobacterium algicola]
MKFIYITMIKYFTILFLFACSYCVTAQSSYNLKGKVLDIASQVPLESATVYVTTVKDSTVLEYTLTDKNGNFNFVVKKNDKPVFLKVTYVGYETFSEEQREINGNKDFDNIYLSESINTLNEVTIKGEDPPIRIKNDTIEFKASLFKVRADANVETLLKQLPGFEMDSDGKITVNGKEVTQVLVNGKPFFDRDGAMALKNLPAEIINKVQVSDFKTKKEEYSKDDAASDNSSINLTIDEDKNKGHFGKFLAGYGSDDRYESSFIMNFFNNNRKISLLGSSNNINAPGFSMDEVFDNMGGGRNTKGTTVNRSQANGITKSNLLGFNYSDQLFKELQANANYNFSDTQTDNLNNSSSTNFRPDGDFNTISTTKTQNTNTSNKANVELEYKIAPTMQLFVAPKINTTRTGNTTASSSSTTIEDGTLTNDFSSNSSNQTESNNFSNSINFNKSFEKKARNLSVVLNNDNSSTSSNNFVQSETNLYANDEQILRNQNNLGENSNDSYSAEIEYSEPITDSIRLKIGVEYNYQNAVSDIKSYDFNALDSDYSILNGEQTSYITSKQNSITPKVGLRLMKNKFTFDLNSSTSIVQYDNHSDYLGTSTDLFKNYVLPGARAQVRYKVDRSKFFTARYNYNLSLPSASEILPVINVSNPLNTITGNPDLNPTETHSASVNYRNFDYRTRSGYNLYFNSNLNNNNIITSSVYDADRKRTTTYENVSGTYSLSAGGNWGKSIKQEANLLRFGIALSVNHDFEKGFTDSVLYGAKSIGITPKAYVNYDYGQLFTIAPSYNFSYNETNYDIDALKSRSNIVHRLNLQTTSYWPVNWIWGNDFGYTYNSINQDFYLWNSSLSYTFLNKMFTAKVKVYDILNQNQSITRSISTTSVSDNENTVLKRYAMFSLTYKIENFSGMKNPSKRNEKERGGMNREDGDRGDRPEGRGDRGSRAD